MKKALILISFILAAIASFSFKGSVGKLPTSTIDTFINKQTVGSATTLYVSKGGLRGDTGIIISNVLFADTTAANFSRVSGYNGSIIQCVGAKYWIRSLNPNKWNPIALGDLTGYVRVADTSAMLTPYHAAYYSATFDTSSRVLTLYPITGNAPTTLTIPRGGNVTGIASLTSSRVGNIVTLTGDNGSTVLFSVRDADSATQGTVTSVTAAAPISVTNGTSTPYIQADTGRSEAQIATGGSLNKVRDSLQSNINLKLNISDTSTMLSNLLRKTDTSTMLNPYLRKSDTATMLSGETLDRVLANGNSTGRNAFLGYLVASGASATPTVTGAYLFDQRLLSVTTGGGSRPLSIDAQYIAFGTGNTYVEKARVDSFGSLLIGTSTSNAGAYKLDVVGSVRVSSLPSYTSGGTYIVSNSGILSSRTASEVRVDIGAGTGNGTVTSVAAGNGLTFTTITTSGTVTADTTILSTKDNVLNQLNKYTGTTNTSTVGTITTGTWNGSVVGVAYGGTGLNTLASQRIPFGNGTSAFGSSTGLTWDGTNMNASNFAVFSGGAYFTPGSSGGTSSLMYNSANSYVLKSAFDTLRLQGGQNDANKRPIAFYNGSSSGYTLLLDENGKFSRIDALTLSLNNNEYATTAFVKGQGYLTSAVTSATGTTNQVIVSASTGAVTFSLPQSIATSSNVQFGTILSQASTTYSLGTTYSIAANPTTTFSGTLPTSNASFSAILAPFNNVISDNTTVNGNTSYGAVLASSVLSFSNAAYRTLTMSNSSGGVKANAAIVAGTFDAGTQRGNVNTSAGVMINGIFRSGTYSLKRDFHAQLIINGITEFGFGDSVLVKRGIYQNGADSNYIHGVTLFDNGLSLEKNQNATTEILASNTDNTNSTSRGRVRIVGGTVEAVLSSFATDRVYAGASSNHPLALITNGSSRITVNTSGNVQFNNYGAGTLTTDASGNITASSDTTMKNLIAPLDTVLGKIMDFKPYYFKWRASTGLDTANQYLSITAQSIGKSFPLALGKSSDGTLTVQDRAVLAITVKAVQELKEENDKLKTVLQELEAILKQKGIM